MSIPENIEEILTRFEKEPGPAPVVGPDPTPTQTLSHFEPKEVVEWRRAKRAHAIWNRYARAWTIAQQVRKLLNTREQRDESMLNLGRSPQTPPEETIVLLLGIEYLERYEDHDARLPPFSPNDRRLIQSDSFSITTGK